MLDEIAKIKELMIANRTIYYSVSKHVPLTDEDGKAIDLFVVRLPYANRDLVIVHPDKLDALKDAANTQGLNLAVYDSRIDEATILETIRKEVNKTYMDRLFTDNSPKLSVRFR